MLRFFSRRGRPRRDQKAAAEQRYYANLRHSDGPDHGGGRGRSTSNRRSVDKRSLACQVILLDGSVIPIEIQVRLRGKVTRLIMQ